MERRTDRTLISVFSHLSSPPHLLSAGFRERNARRRRFAWMRMMRLNWSTILSVTLIVAASMCAVLVGRRRGRHLSSHGGNKTEMATHSPERRILVVEDEPAIASFVRRGLIFEGFTVQALDNGRDALQSIRDDPPDLLVLDVMLPQVDGIELTRRVRAAEAADGRRQLPILMLTARDAVADRIAGLDVGADDYLVKPFDFDELLARIRALLRRANTAAYAENGEVLRFADVAVDLAARTVVRAGRALQLTPREFDLLALFLRHPNQVLTRSTLMQRVWGEDFYGESNVLEVVVGNLRRALEAAEEPRLIQTVRGVGYVLRES